MSLTGMCFTLRHILLSHICLKNKATWIEITVETAIGGGELQNAIVGVGYAARIILLVSLAPNHLFARSICQNLHRSAKHHTLETVGIRAENIVSQRQKKASILPLITSS